MGGLPSRSRSIMCTGQRHKSSDIKAAKTKCQMSGPVQTGLRHERLYYNNGNELLELGVSVSAILELLTPYPLVGGPWPHCNFSEVKASRQGHAGSVFDEHPSLPMALRRLLHSEIQQQHELTLHYEFTQQSRPTCTEPPRPGGHLAQTALKLRIVISTPTP